MIPNILSIAGSDPSGGAGIQADINAISARGGYAMAALTALTAQNTRGVSAVQMVAPDFVAAEIAAIRDDICIPAVKTGMLGTADIIDAVAQALRGLDAPIVLDPVMVAKGGDRRLAAEAVAALRERLLPMAGIITPNLPEAADLLGTEPATDLKVMADHAQALRVLGAQAVLIKGGHLGGQESPDLLVSEGGITHLPGPRIKTRNTHGTGCSLSSVLACELGHGHALPEAATPCQRPPRPARGRHARQGVALGYHRWRRQPARRGGHGPVHHFHNIKELQP